MSAYASKYNLGLDGKGYIISQNKNGVRYYQKKRSPTFVNKFGGGDSSYRDATFWQYFVQTNFRNGAKQLKFDDPGKFWKSSDVDTTILEELSLSRSFTSAGQLASGIKVNAMEAWRSSATWWNSSYGYRQQLTITNSSSSVAPIGHPIKVTVDSAAIETATHVRSDRKDWRIIYDNGSTLTDLSRDYVSTTSTFFALQATIAAGGSDSHYYLYYGYSSESTTKQPSTEAEWNAVYGMYGVTPDANSVLSAHFREGSSTTVADDSSSANTGTYTNADWGTDGKFGRYGTFNGHSSNRRVDFGSDGTLNLGSMTLEGWVYWTGSAANEGEIFTKRKSDNSGHAFAFGVTEGGKLFFTNGNDSDCAGSTTLTSSTWYHVAATYDGSSTAKVYLNGVQDGTQTWASGVVSSSGKSLKVAERNAVDGVSGISGRLQHLRVSNTARTSFPYILSAEPSVSAGSETTTQPPSSTFDLYAGGTDGKVYKWDGITTWTEQFDTRRLTWYDTTSLVDIGRPLGDIGGTEYALSQGFQLAVGQTIAAAQVYLKKNSGTPGNITVRIETNNAGVPSGTLANASATGTITAFTTTSYDWVEVTFAGTFSLSASTTYHLVLTTAAAANDNSYVWGGDSSSPSYSGGTESVSSNGGSTWGAESGTDQMFRVLGQSTSVNCMLLTALGGTQKLYVGTGNPTGQTNGDARLYSYDGTTWVLAKSFVSATESMINSMTEYSTANKVYIGTGPQAKIYETSDFSTFTLSKDINVPQNPGYVYALKEYNRVLHAGGGSPEFLPAQYYNGFVNTYDTTAWNILYPFDFTVIKSLEFYDAYLFMGTYHGHLYVYDTSTLNPLFNFKDQFSYRVSIQAMKYFDDKLHIGLYPQDGSNETNVGIWIFDRRGLSLAYTISGVTGYRCFAVVNGTLFAGTGDNGYVYKLDPNTYKASGWYQSSYYDANLPSIDKLYNSVTLRHDPLNNGESITVYYRFKESDSWTTLGLSNTVGAIEKVLSFPSATYSKKISLKVELATTDTTASPKLTEVVMQYSLYPTRKWQWSIRIKAKSALRLLDGTLETRTAEQIRQDLETLLATQQLYNFVDIDGTSYTVLFNDLDTQSWVINSLDTANEEEVVISILES